MSKIYEHDILLFVYDVGEKIDFDILPEDNIGLLIAPKFGSAGKKLTEAIAKNPVKGWEAISHSVSYQGNKILISVLVRRLKL